MIRSPALYLGSNHGAGGGGETCFIGKVKGGV